MTMQILKEKIHDNKQDLFEWLREMQINFDPSTEYIYPFSEKDNNLEISTNGNTNKKLS